MDWSCVDYLWIIVKFLFAIWDTVILMASATFLQMCSNEETNSSTTWMAWWGVNFKFWVNSLFLPLNIVEGYLDFNKCLPVQDFFFTCALACVLKEGARMSGGVWTCRGLGGNKITTAKVIRMIIHSLVEVLLVHIKQFIHTYYSENLSVNYCWIPVVLPEAFFPGLWYQTGLVCPHYVHRMNQSGALPMSLVEKGTSEYLKMIIEGSFHF